MAQWRGAFYSFLENINGNGGFACPVVCANGRVGKAGPAGGAGRSSPVSAQSTSKASDVDHKALALNNSLNSCVRACVRVSVCMRVRAAARFDRSSSPNAALLRVRRE